MGHAEGNPVTEGQLQKGQDPQRETAGYRDNEQVGEQIVQRLIAGSPGAGGGQSPCDQPGGTLLKSPGKADLHGPGFLEVEFPELFQREQPPAEAGPQDHLLQIHHILLLVDDDDRIAAIGSRPALEMPNGGVDRLLVHEWITPSYGFIILIRIAVENYNTAPPGGQWARNCSSFRSFWAALEIQALTWLL